MLSLNYVEMIVRLNLEILGRMGRNPNLNLCIDLRRHRLYDSEERVVCRYLLLLGGAGSGMVGMRKWGSRKRARTVSLLGDIVLG